MRSAFLASPWISLATVLFSMALFFGFGMHHLTKFVTADEHYWMYERIPTYWEAWKEGKYKATLINDKPGVSLALVSGAGLLTYPDPASHMTSGTGGNPDIFLVSKTEHLNQAFRLPILLFNTLLIPVFYWLFRLLTDRRIATYGVIFLATSPILIGISQIVNPDALLWSLGGISLFSFLAFLKTKQINTVFLSGTTLGFAMLSKYVANILPFFFVATLIGFLMMIEKAESEKIRALTVRGIFAFLGILVLAILVIIAGIPAVLIKPKYLFDLTVGFPHAGEAWIVLVFCLVFLVADCFLFSSRSILSAIKIFRWNMLSRCVSCAAIFVFLSLIIGRNFSPNWHIFNVPFDMKNLSSAWRYADTNWLETILLQFNPLVFSLPIASVVLLVFLWTNELFRRKESSSESFLIFSLTMFLFAYLAASTLSNTLSTIRYGILFYPVVALLSGIAFSQVLELRIFSRLHQVNVWSVLFLLAILLPSLMISSPFFFNFTNSLLPKDRIITDAWGYGGYEAATYLNTLPDSANITVWSDYFGVCEFFVGTCFTDYKPKAGHSFDYYVLSRRGEIRYQPDHVRWTMEDTDDRERIRATRWHYHEADPVWELEIDGRPENFIKVISTEKE